METKIGRDKKAHTKEPEEAETDGLAKQKGKETKTMVEPDRNVACTFVALPSDAPAHSDRTTFTWSFFTGH